MAGRKGLHALEARPSRAGAEEGEKMIDPLRVGLGLDESARKQRLEFRSPQEPPIALSVVERTDADAVTTEDQRPRARVPQRHSELAVRLLEHPLAAIFIQMDPGFRVATGGEL